MVITKDYFCFIFQLVLRVGPRRHYYAIDELRDIFGDEKEIRILDAGAGSGLAGQVVKDLISDMVVFNTNCLRLV